MARCLQPFDFDEWKTLFETNPQAFETRRRERLEAEIARAPAPTQPRLRGLQWRIDMLRNRYQNPVVCSAKLFELMWQQVYGENGLLDALNGTTSPALDAKRRPATVTAIRRNDYPMKRR